ncbi:MAG: hypothetical protein FWH18_05325 [Marinilabiliaceae bacterium]|nr:hypothetical protein [Marinilabiliaceae bacterium]
MKNNSRKISTLSIPLGMQRSVESIYAPKTRIPLGMRPKVILLYHKRHKVFSRSTQRVKYQHISNCALCAFFVFFVVKNTFHNDNNLKINKL